MMRTALTLTMTLILLVGCASTETVRESRGEGTKNLYSATVENVYAAALRAAKSEELEIVATDKDAGRIDLSHGVTLWSWGERISVFVTSVSDSETEVEIVSKAVMSPLNFPPDWEGRLFRAIDRELEAAN